MDALRGGDGTIEYRSVDCADQNRVKSLVDDIVSGKGRLDGVIHAAGTLRDGLLKEKSRAAFESVLRSKLPVASALDAATSQLPLDLFVIFSSATASLGNAGQTDYAYANAWLSAFARWRAREVMEARRSGLTLSIEWPLWLDTGMGVDDKDARFMEENSGLRALSRQIGVDLAIALPEIVAARDAAVTVLSGERDRIRAFLEQDSVDGVPAAEPVLGVSMTRTDIAATLAGFVAEISGLALDEIALDDHWGDLGLNSIAMQQLTDRIDRDLGGGGQIPASALFTYGSVSKLAAYLEGKGVAHKTEAPEPADVVHTEPNAAAFPRPDGVASEEACAIVGMAARLPGGADPDAFWDFLLTGEDGLSENDRWADRRERAGFIDGMDRFDARFFGLSAREAMLMDPQHRLFLQTAYETVLNAGYAPRQIPRTGVFTGVQFNDYQVLLQQWGRSRHPFAATGNAHAMLANRVSYLFNYDGPSETIDTACSSALVAVHRAIQSLNHGECDQVLCGAVSLMIDPVVTDAARSMGVLSEKGRCATFDNAADGYVRGEGVGCLMVKRLDDALRDRDPIHALLLTSAVNHGGRANSLTSPNPHAQAKLLKSAYTSELAARVSFIETHGTGTRLGDPIEINALKQAWRDLRPDAPEGSIGLGAVKTNVGHLEPAAGVPALVKTIQALRHRKLPGNRNFIEQNGEIDLVGSPFYLLDRPHPWGADCERVAGISSFGFGGSNAHVVLAEAPDVSRVAPDWPAHLVVLSARSAASLDAMRTKLGHWLSRPANRNRVDLGSVAHTLSVGRDHLTNRFAVVVRDLDDLVEQLLSDQVDAIPARQAVLETPPPSADRRSPSPERLEAFADAYRSGAAIDLSDLYEQGKWSRVHLPGYVFDECRFWFETAADLMAVS